MIACPAGSMFIVSLFCSTRELAKTNCNGIIRTLSPKGTLGVWLSPVERTVRVREAKSSNLFTPTDSIVRSPPYPKAVVFLTSEIEYCVTVGLYFDFSSYNPAVEQYQIDLANAPELYRLDHGRRGADRFGCRSGESLRTRQPARHPTGGQCERRWVTALLEESEDGGLTVGVTRVWAGVDSAWEQKKLEARKMLVNRAESHTSGARGVGRIFNYSICL